MTRFLLAIRVLLCAIPSYLFGLFLTFFFPHISFQLQFGLTAVMLAGLAYLIYRSRQPYLQEENADDMPFLLHGSMYIALFIGAIGGVFWSFMAFKTDLYVDNGRNKPVHVSYPPYINADIPAKSSKSFLVPVAEAEITLDGKLRKLNITRKGNWIFNIDSLNTYVEANVKYFSSSNLSAADKLNPQPDLKPVKAELFHTKAELIFEIPDTLQMKENRKTMTKLALYRLSVNPVTGDATIY